MPVKIPVSLWMDVHESWTDYSTLTASANLAPKLEGYRRYRIDIEIDDPRDFGTDVVISLIKPTTEEADSLAEGAEF